MTQIPILSGIRASDDASFDASYPVNLEPVIINSGISQGFLKVYPGTAELGAGPGIDRGGINWNGTLYRVMGQRLVSVAGDGSISDLGDVGTDGKPVSLDYSFDYLSIGSNGNLFYWDASNGLRQVTDPDLGAVIDHMFIAGYNMTTDGTYIVVTELSDPMSVDPLKYGSSESDPDPITGLAQLRNEAYALNRYTTDVFQNAGGNGFPFANVPGAVIPRGCVSRSAKCMVGESLVMVGSGRNEALGVYELGAGQTTKLSTREIDDFLAEVDDPAQIVLEALSYGDNLRLMVHLPDKTLVFLPEASNATKAPVWYVRKSAAGAYRPRFFALVYGDWYCGDTQSPAIGKLDTSLTADFGETKPWEFVTQFLYNEGRGAIVHSVELIGLPGRVPFAQSGAVFMSRSLDGQVWGEEREVSSGGFGQRLTRVQLRPHWRMRNYLAMKFRGYDLAHAGWARCEAVIEPLN